MRCLPTCHTFLGAGLLTAPKRWTNKGGVDILIAGPDLLSAIYWDHDNLSVFLGILL
jgi:hypothetical protein